MKPNEKRMIIILLIITVIAIIFFAKSKNKVENSEEISTEETSEYVQTSEDGTKQATSSKLQETKTVEDLEISNIQIKEINGVATLTASVKNNSTKTKKEFPLTIKLLDESGNAIETLGAYVGTVAAGESRGINASINMDISDVYDISIEL